MRCVCLSSASRTRSHAASAGASLGRNQLGGPFMKRWLALAAPLCCSPLLSASAQDTPKPIEPKPAFAGQTDAPAPRVKSKYRTEVITDNLTGPWAVAFLPDGNFLVTERRGVLRTVSPKGVVSEPIAGVPPVKVTAAQSFHDVVLDPKFAENRY